MIHRSATRLTLELDLAKFAFALPERIRQLPPATKLIQQEFSLESCRERLRA